MAALSAAPFLVGIGGTFLADDWPLLAQAAAEDWTDPARYLTTTHGWYRPSFLVLLGALLRVVGPSAVSAHMVVWLSYVVVVAVVGSVVSVVGGSRRAQVAATATFGCLSVHAEPVLWLAAWSEVPAIGLAVVSLGLVVGPDSGSPDDPAATSHVGRARDLVALGAFVAALTFKETAVFLPLGLIGMAALHRLERRAAHVGFGARAWRRAPLELPRPRPVPSTLIVVTGLAYLAFRLPAGSPYSVEPDPALVLRSTLFYAATTVGAVPEGYLYRTAWSASIAGWVVPVALGLVAAAGWLCLLRAAELHRLGPRMARLAVLWIAGIAPVALVATGRTAFAASIAVAWGAGALVEHFRPARKRVAALGLALVLASNILGGLERSISWRAAAAAVECGVSGIDTALARPRAPQAGPVAVKEVCLAGAPDHVRHAYAYRNALAGLAAMNWPEASVRVLTAPSVAACQAEHPAAQVVGMGRCPVTGPAILHSIGVNRVQFPFALATPDVY